MLRHGPLVGRGKERAFQMDAQQAHFPVTLLQEHPDALLRITEFVANLPE